LTDHLVIWASRLLKISLELLENWLGLKYDPIAIGIEIGNSLMQVLADLKFSLLLVLLLGKHHLLIGINFG
jgi:hypothetical protein